LKSGKRSYLDDNTSLLTVFYYDNKGRIIQQRGTNHLGGYDIYFYSYTFTGLTKGCVHLQLDSGRNVVIAEYCNFIYDNGERLKQVKHTLNGGQESVLSENEYDDLCRLKKVKLNNGTMTLGYDYNIRNWLTSIESPLFKQKMYYVDGAGIPCYNGNISSVTWQSALSGKLSGYKFSYDGLNRMKDAMYGEGSSLDVNPGYFNEQVAGYDKNGNMLGIKRSGKLSEHSYGLIDNLLMAYDGNRLLAVKDKAGQSVYSNAFEFVDGADEATEYFYDASGNLIKDLNKKIVDIQYNYLNLPSRIEFENGDSIVYLYDANGTKLRATHVIGDDTTVTDYCGNVVYENGVLRLLLTETGYVSLNDDKYHYFIQDYQGNNRVVADEDGIVEEVNDYYPFGGLMASSVGSVQPYKYNGKELDRKGGLDWYDYGARQYDAALGRWHSVDPLAEKFYPFSPYNYCFDNPVKYIDPDGKQGRPTRPPVRRGYRNGGRPNPYAFYPRGMRPQSYVQKTSMTYRGNGTRQMVGMGPQTILNTVNTPGGNEVQMSNNNELGMWLSGFGDLTSNHIEFREKLISLVSTVRYGEDGNVQNSTEIVIDDPQLAMQQLDYEMKAREIEKGLGEVDFTGKSLVESLEMLAERKKVIQDKIGISPKEVIQTELFLHPERFRFGTSTRRILPELIQH